MIFVSWVLFNLLLPHHLITASFTTGTSSSIGVLSTNSLPTSAAANLPFSGTVVVNPDCGWHHAAAGSTSPGFYSVPNFGTFNVGADNIGQANVGYNNIGFGNYGTENTGRLNNGNDNIGYLNDGNGNMGALNTGNFQIGDNNSASSSSSSLPCIGYNNVACSAVIGTFTNQSTYAIGSELQGSYLIGSSSNGSALIGQDNSGENSIGFQNENGTFNGNIGVLNFGDGLIGYNNTGTAIIGQDNTGASLIGIENFGTYEIGYNNTGSMMIGFSQNGTQDFGVLNDGNFLIGFNLTGNNLTGGTYIDTSDIALSIPIIFDPTDTVTSENIGTNFNSQPNETRAGVQSPFIKVIDASWQFNLDFPAILSVVDLGCPGDVIQVYDQFSLLMTTVFPRPPVSMNCSGLDSAEEALADPNYSRNFVTLQPGYHLLTFSLLNSDSGSLLAFKLDSILPPKPCEECEIPLPPLQEFGSDNILNDLPSFGLPPDIHLPDECCILNESSSISDSSTCSSSTCSNSSNNQNSVNPNPSTPVNVTNAVNITPVPARSWCRTKNLQMLRDSYVTHSEALGHCLLGLARPSSPADRLEITSLLFQCPPTHPLPNPTQHISGGQWIGSDWNGRQGGGGSETDCLVAHGEKVLRAKDCNSKRRFICHRF